MSKNDGGPAFPAMVLPVAESTVMQLSESGMSLRDYFAAAAIIGITSKPDPLAATVAKFGLTPTQAVAMVAYDVADAMLAERSKE